MEAVLHAIAPAKLNLYLHIHGKRPDGYHLIESLAVFAALGDELHVSAADKLEFVCDGEFAEPAGGGDDNLVLKAARLLQQKTGCTNGAHIRLTKHIPVGAGLGGGSADAAVALKLLNQLWQLNLTDEILQQWAPELGADVAMCIAARPVMAEGIGERVTPLSQTLPPLYAVMVHPRTPLLTKDVYRVLAASASEGDEVVYPSMDVSGFAPFTRWLAQQRNDLEAPAKQVSVDVPLVLAVLNTIEPQPALVRMSGSGACCYALYETREEAGRAAEELSVAHPEWWVRASKAA